MKFKERTTAPAKSNNYYYKDNIFYKSGYGIPNCTTYAWGRFYELTGKYPKLCTANAENWFKYNDGYERGQTPKLGAVIVWSKGKIGVSKDGAGHVAIVERINADGSILTSNSAYKSTNFYLKTISKGYKMSGYKFEGFIYNPIEFETKTYQGVFPTLPSGGSLKRGTKGEQVKYLQKFLNWCNDSNLAIDGSFGPATETQVKTYQKNNGLVVDGKFGPASLKKAKTITK